MLLLLSVNRCCEQAVMPNLICDSCIDANTNLGINMKEPIRLYPEEIAELEKQPRAVQIAAMKTWCKENYENGADTMVECWGTDDYETLFTGPDIDGLITTRTFAQAFDTLFSVASVYAERQADAAYYARGERDADPT